MRVWDVQEGVTLAISFEEMARRVAIAVAALAGLGVRKAEHLAILSHASAQFYVYALAVMSHGAVCAVLNWRQPLDVLKHMAGSSRSTILMASAAFAEHAAAIAHDVPDIVRVLWLSMPPIAPPNGASLPDLSSASAPASCGGPSRIERVHADTMCLILFTSGSTSMPKPTPFTHDDLLWSSEHNMQQALRFRTEFAQPGAGTVCFLPNFHVIGFMNNFMMKYAPYRPNATLRLSPARA